MVSPARWVHQPFISDLTSTTVSPFICLGFSFFWGKIGDHFSFRNHQKTLFLHLRFYLLLHVLSQICVLRCRIIANATFVETWLPATSSLSLSITQLLLLSHSECYVPKGQGLVKLLSCTALVLRPVFCMITVWNGPKTKNKPDCNFILKSLTPWAQLAWLKTHSSFIRCIVVYLVSFDNTVRGKSSLGNFNPTQRVHFCHFNFFLSPWG